MSLVHEPGYPAQGSALASVIVPRGARGHTRERAMTDNQPLTGSILDVRDCGTLVLVFLGSEDGRTVPVPLDRRAFDRLLEAEGCRPDQLVGRRISYDGNRILFLGWE
jgi:hypothetical protein